MFFAHTDTFLYVGSPQKELKDTGRGRNGWCCRRSTAVALELPSSSLLDGGWLELLTHAVFKIKAKQASCTYTWGCQVDNLSASGTATTTAITYRSQRGFIRDMS